MENPKENNPIVIILTRAEAEYALRRVWISQIIIFLSIVALLLITIL